MAVRCGLDNIRDFGAFLGGARVGLMTNPTGVDVDFRETADVIRSSWNLTALFGCEHGIRGRAQAGAKVEGGVDERTGVPVYSLYGSTVRMTGEMLDAFDVLVYDIQDVGARFYTYLYSLSYALEACARAGKRVLVLDRPNPLGGVAREGAVLDERLRSFVGEYAMPARYGLTVGEYARWVSDHLGLELDLRVAPVTLWRREMDAWDANARWIAPSPNIPTPMSALCYIGTCAFEGTNLSEGRGTTLPFELVGAPWVDADELARRMNAKGLPGVWFRACGFTPVSSKHAGESCSGVQLHVLDRRALRPFEAGLLLLEEIRTLHPGNFEWLGTGDVRHIDHILGDDGYRLGRVDARGLIEKHAPGLAAFGEAVRPYLLYD